MAARSEPVDARADRFVQGAIAVVTLGAFVFRAVWVVPVLAVVVAAGAVLGPAGNLLHRLFAALAAPRLPPARAQVPADTIQAQDMLAAALLAFATLCLLILAGIAWIVALAEAGVAAVAATTGVHLGVMLRDRLSRR